jgi:hypothetical protein
VEVTAWCYSIVCDLIRYNVILISILDITSVEKAVLYSSFLLLIDLSEGAALPLRKYTLISFFSDMSFSTSSCCPPGAAIPSVTSPRRSSYGAASTVGVSMTENTNKSSVSSIIGNGVAAVPRVVRG